jgi:hypothetical protein
LCVMLERAWWMLLRQIGAVLCEGNNKSFFLVL